MDDVLYLIHVSNAANPADIKELRPSSLAEDSGQFPGVFMTLITRDNIDTESLFPGKHILIFSKELLKQRNWHLNATDSNGMINEHNTYFPWSLEAAVSHIRRNSTSASHYDRMNEVVFHDAVPMEFCCRIISKPHLQDDKVFMKYLMKMLNHSLLPRRAPRCRGRTPAPNMALLPFYAFINEDRYDGVEPPPPSSMVWFRRLAEVAGISRPFPRSKQRLIDAIRARSAYLQTHREEQRLEFLMPS